MAGANECTQAALAGSCAGQLAQLDGPGRAGSNGPGRAGYLGAAAGGGGVERGPAASVAPEL